MDPQIDIHTEVDKEVVPTHYKIYRNEEQDEVLRQYFSAMQKINISKLSTLN